MAPDIFCVFFMLQAVSRSLRPPEVAQQPFCIPLPDEPLELGEVPSVMLGGAEDFIPVLEYNVLPVITSYSIHYTKLYESHVVEDRVHDDLAFLLGQGGNFL